MSDNTDNNAHNFDNDNQRDAFNDEHTRSFNDENSSPENNFEADSRGGSTNHIESDSGSSMINDSSQTIGDMSHNGNEEDEESSAIEDVISDIKRDMQEHADDVQQGIEDEIQDAENDDLDNVFADDDSLIEEDDNEEDNSDDAVDFSDPQSSREDYDSSQGNRNDPYGGIESQPINKEPSSNEEKPFVKDSEEPQRKGEEDKDDDILHQENNPHLASSPVLNSNKFPRKNPKENPKENKDVKDQGEKQGEEENLQNHPEKEDVNDSNDPQKPLEKDSERKDKENPSSFDKNPSDHKDRLKKKAAQNNGKNNKDNEREKKRKSPGSPFALAHNLKNPEKGEKSNSSKNALSDEDNPFKITKNAMGGIGKNGDGKGETLKKAAGAAGAAALGAARNKLTGQGKASAHPVKKGQERDDSNKAEFLGEGVADRKKTATSSFSLASGTTPYHEEEKIDPRDNYSEESGKSQQTPKPIQPKKKKKGKKILIAMLVVLAMLVAPPLAMMAGLTTFGPQVANNMQGETPVCDPSDPESAGSSGGDGGPSLGDVGDSTIPAEGIYTSGFGARWGTQHNGVDIANEEGTPIYAAHDGTVISSGPATGYGLWVRIQSDKDPSFVSIYGHQSKNHVKEGDKVKAGDHIADMSSNGFSTGSHLHFQVEKDGKPFDPVQWFDKEDLDFPELQGQVKLEKNGGGSKSSGSKSKDSKNENSKSGSKSGDNSSAHGDSKILIIGDSITEGSKDKIKENIPGAKIDSSVGRQYSEGLSILKKENDKYDTVVMALGTNGPFSQGDIDETIKAAGDAEVVLMTVKGPNVKAADSVNPLVKKNSSKVSIADWESIVDEHPDYISGDGIHPTGEGQQAFADMLGDTVDGSGGSADEEQNTNPVGCVCEAEGKGSTSNGGTPGEGEGATNGDVESRMEKYAPIVIAAGEELGMTEEDIITAIMTVQVESGGWQNWANDGSGISPGNPLHDDYMDEVGRSLEMDHDGVAHDQASVGLFQQQVSRAWGKVDDLMIPAYQAGRFYVQMKNVGVAGKKDNLGANAQTVQGSAFPERYAPEESKSREIYKKYKGEAKLSSQEKKDAKRAWDDFDNGGNGSGGGGGSSSSDDTRGPSGSGVCASNGSGESSGDSEMDGVIDGSNAGDKAKKAAKIALKQIGKPYVWCAAGPDSFDCSGLLTYAYKKAGLNSLIDSGGRFTTYNIPDFGKKVKSKKDIAVGDAIITNGGEHVMMYVGDGQIVEAQQTGVPVLKRPLSEINDIVSIHRFVDENDKELK